MELSSKSCQPCKGGVAPMPLEQAQQMAERVPGWQVADTAKRIQRCYKTRGFRESLEFVNRIGAIAEEQGHHPDISFGWGYVNVEIFTHKIGGLHENDFILAAKLNDALEPRH